MENPERDESKPLDEPDRTTSPEDPTHEATTPPGNGERDDEKIEEGLEQLDQAGGGH